VFHWIQMKNLLTNFKQAAGFTLIELLVVIGILGILASALVATIDPFEQLNKANDTNVKNTSVEYINANIRWYTTHNAFPWNQVVDGGAACNGQQPPNAILLTDANMAGCIDALISDRELKPAFKTAKNQLKEIYATYDVPTGQLIACFKPKSASQQKDPNTKYTSSGADGGATCKSQPNGTADCYWCAK